MEIAELAIEILEIVELQKQKLSKKVKLATSLCITLLSQLQHCNS